MATKPKKSNIIQMSSALVSRAALALRAGIQFGGKRDLYKVFGYKTNILHSDYLAKYSRQDIAARIINAPAAATWQDFPTIVPTNTDFTEPWEAHVNETSLWTRFERIDKLAGLGRYAVLLIGFDDGQNLEAPVRQGSSRKILYLQPYGDAAVKIKSYISDPQNARYALPEMYAIKVVDPRRLPTEGSTSSLSEHGMEVFVHHSRIIHVAENTLENDVFGTPRLEQVYNLLDDLLKVAGGSAEGFWLTNNRGMQLDVDKEMELTPADEVALSEELDEYMHEQRRVLRTKGVTVKPLGSTSTDPQGTFKMIIALISGATGIPQRILLGAEAGQLASMVDRANWSDRISERRIDFGEPIVLRPYVASLVSAGAVPNPGKFKVEWPEAFKLTPLERDQAMAQKARAVVNLSRRGKDGSPLISDEEARGVVGFDGPVIGTLPEPPEPAGGGGDGGGGPPSAVVGAPAEAE